MLSTTAVATTKIFRIDKNGNENANANHRRAVIGNPKGSFWLYDSETGYDLTHPPTPFSPTVDNAITLQTTTLPIKVDPAKCALVIVDLQNFFLSPALGLPPQSNGLRMLPQLINYTIPAARKAGMQVVWLNWAMSDDDLDKVPASTHRAFGYGTVEATHIDKYYFIDDKLLATDSHAIMAGANLLIDETAQIDMGHFNAIPLIAKGLGNPIGPIVLEDGTVVDAGRTLMKDTWNVQLLPELQPYYEEGLKLAHKPDVTVYKSQISGLWGPRTECTDFLEKAGITTLFFAGVNTDQCVGGSFIDAYSRGYDVILMRDAVATPHPPLAQQCYEFNAAKTYGFCMTSVALWDAVNSGQSV